MSTTTKQHAPSTPRVHAPWCVWTVEEEHDPVDECIGAERRVDISRERKYRMTDSSWRRPYMQANIATDDGNVTIHLGYDEELGHPVGLALLASLGRSGPVDLDDSYPGACDRCGDPDAVAASAFDPDRLHRSAAPALPQECSGTSWSVGVDRAGWWQVETV